MKSSTIILLLTFLFSMNVSAAVMEKGDASAGARKWAERCGHCHNFRSPEEFRDDLWQPIVTHMRLRGGMSGEDARDILEFLRQAN